MSKLIDKIITADKGCFVRCTGVSGTYTEDIEELDRIYGGKDYIRVNTLTPPSDPAELEALRLEAMDFEDSFEGARVLALYRSSVATVNPSIEKNLVISILHWRRLLGEREGLFIYCGRTGYKEFLFCYLASMLGWKVFMLMPVGEGKLAEVLTERAERLELGMETPVDIPEYVPRPVPAALIPSDGPELSPIIVPERRRSIPTAGEYVSHGRSPVTGNIRVTVPPRERRRGNVPAKGEYKCLGRSPETGNIRVSVPPRERRRASQPCPAAAQMTSQITDMTAVKKKLPELSHSEAAGLSGSVVMIEAPEFPGMKGIQGSGIAVSEDGFIVTCFGLIRDAMQINVKVEGDDRTYYGRVIKYHNEHDLAVLRIERRLEPLPMAKTALYRGQKLYFIGSSGTGRNLVSEGSITGFKSFYNGEAIQFTSAFFAGSTGGALINAQGELIGMCYGSIYGLHAVDLAVSSRVIEPFVKGFV